MYSCKYSFVEYIMWKFVRFLKSSIWMIFAERKAFFYRTANQKRILLPFILWNAAVRVRKVQCSFTYFYTKSKLTCLAWWKTKNWHLRVELLGEHPAWCEVIVKWAGLNSISSPRSRVHQTGNQGPGYVMQGSKVKGTSCRESRSRVRHARIQGQGYIMQGTKVQGTSCMDSRSKKSLAAWRVHWKLSRLKYQSCFLIMRRSSLLIFMKAVQNLWRACEMRKPTLMVRHGYDA